MAVVRRGVSRLLLAALAGAVVLIGPSLVREGSPAAAEPASSGRYYVVGKPVNGQREYLYDIALKTLGNGNRYTEIVELNEGRRQPDGGALVDAMEVRPGWVLELPADAEGAGVLTARPAGLAAKAPHERPSAMSGRTGDDGVSLTRIGVFGLAVLIIVAGLAMLRAGSRERVVPAADPYPSGPPPPPPPPPFVPHMVPSEAVPELPVRRRTIERLDRSILDAGRPVAPGPEPARMAAAETEVLAGPDTEVRAEEGTEVQAEETDAPGNGITTLGGPWKRAGNTPPVTSSARSGDAAASAVRKGADAGEPSASGDREAEPARPVL
ncbi:hypothetical protein [Actinoplanes sp. NBRC 103695]|uniref:hypothetical protein n=1 Tax=Actinoplanes sp. NBRC 103695 TaxID=3032202 RepID=UPI0024A08833|nr:hypothetical protein [Actinoplanes sp. NBRC 103695]GLY97264.1 hypothetical protein Acsp02_45180 [Actinoplanes sp. NBRC 103695]